MRIAFFTEVFVPKVDGIVNTMCKLLEHLDRRGHECLVFAPAGAPPSVAGARVVGVPAFSVPLYPELRLPAPIGWIGRTLDEFSPDLIHSVNPVSLGLAGLHHARRRDVPLVASYHTDLPGFAERWGFSACGPALWKFIRFAHGSAALNLCPSKQTLADLDAHGIPNLAIWGRGVDTERFRPCRRTSAMRARLSQGVPNRPLLLYVGRLSREKRVEWIDACLNIMPDARLAIVGDGPERTRLEAHYAGKPVHFTGYLHGDELAEAYASADIFTFPGANETLGNVVLEAMASGLPVVAPSSGGVLDHIDDGRTGLLFAPESRASMAGAVRRLQREPALAQRIRTEGLARARSLTWSAEHDRLIERYEQVLSDSRLRAFDDASVRSPAA